MSTHSFHRRQQQLLVVAAAPEFVVDTFSVVVLVAAESKQRRLETIPFVHRTTQKPIHSYSEEVAPPEE